MIKTSRHHFLLNPAPKTICLFLLFLFLVSASHQIDDDVYIDPRDNQVYRTVIIGDRIWFQENLKFITPHSVCYKNEEANCEKYGRLYPVTEIHVACPEHWRLPDSMDSAMLHKEMGTTKINPIAMTGEWDVKGSDKFDNRIGLSVLPAGRIDSFSTFFVQEKRWVDTLAFHQKGSAASFWLNSDLKENGLLHWHLGEPVGNVRSAMHRHNILPEEHKFSIRCVCDKRE